MELPFVQLYKKLEAMQNAEPMNIAMAGFKLKNTLSDFGSVNRGVCVVDNGKLTSIEETYSIRREADGKVHSGKDGQPDKLLDEDCYVSMNIWACPAGFIDKLDKHFIFS